MSSRYYGYKAIYVPAGTTPGLAKRQVWEGIYQKTRGGLTRRDLMENRHGRIVSRRKHAIGMRLQRQYDWRDNPEFVEYAGDIQNVVRRR